MITVKIREYKKEESWVDNDCIELLNQLLVKGAKIAHAIDMEDIPVDKDTVWVWVKRFTDKKTGTITYYPKIEVDAGGQELQIDLDPKCNYKELHFKTFPYDENGKCYRQDIEKYQACPELQQIYKIVLGVEAE